MPLPTPNDKEKKSDFVSRCLSSEMIRKDSLPEAVTVYNSTITNPGHLMMDQNWAATTLSNIG